MALIKKPLSPELAKKLEGVSLITVGGSPKPSKTPTDDTSQEPSTPPDEPIESDEPTKD